MKGGACLTALQWVAVALVCVGFEIASAGFWFMWLGISGFIVAVLAFTGIIASLSVQFLVFALCSLILIIFTRPLLLRFIHVKDTHSNTDAIIGRTGVVILPVSPLQFGQVKVNGEIWTASAETDLAKGQRVKVIAVDGVKLRVEADGPVFPAP